MSLIFLWVGESQGRFSMGGSKEDCNLKGNKWMGYKSTQCLEKALVENVVQSGKQKYIDPMIVEDYIRFEIKTYNNAFAIWKVIVLAFPLGNVVMESQLW